MAVPRRARLTGAALTSAVVVALAGAATAVPAGAATAVPAAATIASRAAAAGNALAAPVTLARGLDVSSYQHLRRAIDWSRLARGGFRFAAIKATEGDYYRNPYYGADARKAANAGLAVLPYVFANPARAGGRATAVYALRVIGPGHGREPIVVDLEDNPYARHAACYDRRGKRIVAWIGGFVSVIHRATGRFPVIYTTAAWWRRCTGASAQFARDPLWLAAYGAAAPAAPSPWRQWAFLQYTDAGRVPGVGRVDLDYFHPTDALPALNPKRQHRSR